MEVALNAQYTRMLVEDARAALADNAGEAAAETSSLFAVTPKGDKEFQAREKIRRELVREWFDVDADEAESARPSLAGKLARLLRLS